MRPPRDFTTNRSNSYQYVIMESPDDPETLTTRSDREFFASAESHEPLKERMDELDKDLRTSLWGLIDIHLTPRQKEVMVLWIKENLTQIEIAKQLGVNQSSITKSINGNTDYRNGDKKVYGGAIKKLTKAAEDDVDILDILEERQEILQAMSR